MRWVSALCTLILTACCLTPLGAFAADHEFCVDYARAAVHEARLAHELPHCGR